MEKDLKRAKEIFWEYACNHFFLDRDGMKEEYELLGGGKSKIENDWRKEFIQYWFEKINENELQSFHNLMNSEAKEILNPLVNKKIKFKDDYIKFWYAFTIKNLANGYEVNFSDKNTAIKKAKEIFSELINKKIYLTEENRQQITGMMKEALKADTEEEYIINYSKDILKTI